MKKMGHAEISCLLPSRVGILFRKVTRISFLLFINCFSINYLQNEHCTTWSPLMYKFWIGNCYPRIQGFELFPKPGKIYQAHLLRVLKAGKSSSNSLPSTSLPSYRYPSASPLHSLSVLKGPSLSETPTALSPFALIPPLQST